MRMLVIEEKDKAAATEVVNYARKQKNWFIVRRGQPQSSIPGYNPRLIVELFDGFRCVFSYTLNTSTDRLFRHLSVGVPGENYPSPIALREIALLFGFTMSDPNLELSPDWIVMINEADRCVIVAQEIDRTSLKDPLETLDT